MDELKKTLYKEFNALPPGEQKLICGGRVMSNAYIVGEYLPLDQRSTLMLMSQPDGEKEVGANIEKAKSVAGESVMPCAYTTLVCGYSTLPLYQRG